MKISLLRKTLPIIITFLILPSLNTSLVNTNEPITQEKYNGRIIKNQMAQFIWTSCIEELRKDKILSNEDVENIHRYLR